MNPDNLAKWKKQLAAGRIEWHDWQIEELIEEIEKLQRHIDQMSCCCAGCTKHNLNIGRSVCEHGNVEPLTCKECK